MKAVVRLLGAAVIAVSLAACHAGSADQGAAQMQLKLYQVPASQSQSIAKHLGAVLEDTQFRAGLKTSTHIRVSQPFAGTVMVLAPASLQPSIAAAVAKLDKYAADANDQSAATQPQPVPVPVRVRFWMVQAVPGKGRDASQLAALEPTLKRVGGRLGPSHFVLNETVATIANAAPAKGNRSGSDTAEISTNHHHRYQFDAAMTADGKVQLDLKYSDGENSTIPSLQSTITLQPGKYVVLAMAPGQSGAHGSGVLMNLLVVRVDRLAAATH